MLMIGMAIALVGYTVFPTAPPRFMPEWGFIDSVADLTGVKVSNTGGSLTAMFNPYAAVPSMHVAFAMMIGWPLARLVRTPALRVAWLVYPFLMTFVIVVTANHFIVDALLGALTAGAAAFGAMWLARMRPDAWRFSSARVVRVSASGSGAGALFDGSEATRRPPPPAAPRLPRATAPGARADRRGRTPRARQKPPHRVAADAQRDLAHGPCAEPARRGAGVGRTDVPRRHRLHRGLDHGHAGRALLAHVGQGD